MAQRRDTRRRFEQWVKNPDCQANTVSAVAGVDMAEVARQEGLATSMGQSPFAIARGQTFEAGLFRDAAARLREALVEAGVLASGSRGFVDLRLRMNSGPMKDLATAISQTNALLTQAATGARRPSIVAAATLDIPGMPVMLPDGVLAIDALVLRPAEDGRVELVIGEIKSYPDRAGHTDSAELATSRAQAGVYLHALELVVEKLGLTDRVTCSQKGFLVLSQSGSNVPKVRPDEEFAFQARRAERGFARLRAAAKELQPFDPQDNDQGVAAVLGADRAYVPSCLSFCDRAPGCRRAAEASDDPAILGEEVRQFLGTTLLSRAIELMHGADPKNRAEEDLASRMRAAQGGAA